MYKIIFKSREQLIEKIQAQLGEAQRNFDSLLRELPNREEYDKTYIRRRIHHAFEFFTENILFQDDSRSRSFCHVTMISDIGQRLVVLPMLNNMMQFATSIFTSQTTDIDGFIQRYQYYYNIKEYLNVIAKLLCSNQYVFEFNAYRVPISLETLQENEHMELFQDEIRTSYEQTCLAMRGRKFGKS